MYTLTNEQIKKDIQDGLMAYKKLAKVCLKQRWKKLSIGEKTDAARALVFMESVAKNPDKYFSREQTENAWRERGKKYAIENNFKEAWPAFYIVSDPKGIVWNNAKNAMEYPLNGQYYQFLNDIQNYEYAKDEYMKNYYGIKINDDAMKVRDKNKPIKLNPLLKLFKIKFNLVR